MTFEGAAWLVTSGLGALALGSAAWGVERAFGARAHGLAAGLWWASLVRLALPPGVGSPVGLRLEVPETPYAAQGDWLLGAWAVGAVALATLAALRLHRERRRWRRAAWRAPRAATRRVAERAARRAGLARVPSVRLHDGPAACVGVLDPWVAVPLELDRAHRRRDLEVVLLHEFAHVARRDGLRRLVVLLVQCAFWFHPTVWLAGRRLGALAELECDRRAASDARGGVATCRRALLAEARGWFAGERLLARPFLPPESLLLERLRALGVHRRSRRSAPWLAFALALACVGPAVQALAASPLEELEGCLQKRFAVQAALAAAAEQDPSR